METVTKIIGSEKQLKLMMSLLRYLNSKRKALEKQFGLEIKSDKEIK